MDFMEDNSKEISSGWERAFRGTLLSTIISKQVTYVGLSDQRAQGIITLNALIIPICFQGLGNPKYSYGALIAIVTSCLVIVLATISILHRQHKIDESNPFDPFHFSHISKLELGDYLEKMRKEVIETNNLAQLAIRDIHYVASQVLERKFFWLKLAYIVFLIGTLSAVTTTLVFN